MVAPVTETVIRETITLTPPAVQRVRRLLEERNLHDHALRVFVSGGGCSGMQYGMALEGNPREADQRFAFEGVDVIVDPMSMTYLAGCTIDYVEAVMGGGFRIENPNAVSSCGCGHSFRTAGEAAHGAASDGGCDCH